MHGVGWRLGNTERIARLLRLFFIGKWTNYRFMQEPKRGESEMAKIVDGPESILDIASWLGGGAYSIMYAVKNTGLRDAIMTVAKANDKDEFEQKLLRIAEEAAEELACSQEDIEFVVAYMG